RRTRAHADHRRRNRSRKEAYSRSRSRRRTAGAPAPSRHAVGIFGAQLRADRSRTRDSDRHGRLASIGRDARACHEARRHRRGEIMKREEVFERMSPPPGGLATLRDRIERPPSLVRAYAPTGFGVALAVAVTALFFIPSDPPPPDLVAHVQAHD